MSENSHPYSILAPESKAWSLPREAVLRDVPETAKNFPPLGLEKFVQLCRLTWSLLENPSGAKVRHSTRTYWVLQSCDLSGRVFDTTPQRHLRPHAPLPFVPPSATEPSRPRAFARTTAVARGSFSARGPLPFEHLAVFPSPDYRHWLGKWRGVDSETLVEIPLILQVGSGAKAYKHTGEFESDLCFVLSYPIN